MMRDQRSAITLLVAAAFAGGTLAALADVNAVLPKSAPAPSAKGAAEKGADKAADTLRMFNQNKALAEQGDAQAAFNLGVMHFKGEGQPKNFKAGVEAFRKAADQGLVQAQFNLGVIFRDGTGVPQDYQQAMLWFRKAAEQGYLQAQHDIGMMYFNQMGVAKDLVQAHMWFNLASVEGNETSVKYRKIIEAEMTIPQVLKAQQLARDWAGKHHAILAASTNTK